jgi:3-phosphoshikimate 1-carboxyvinyltransferase
MIDIAIPGDKSISHRSLMFAILAEGDSRIRGLLRSADVEATASCLRALGASIPEFGDDIRVRGLGLHGLRSSGTALDCANSGTTARLLIGIVAGQGITATFTGDESLSRRPMRRVTDPLRRMGANIEELGIPDCLPLRVRGNQLKPIQYVSPRSSAQVKSAVLLAAVTSGVKAAFAEPVLSRDHTERMLNAMGMELRTVVEKGGMRIELEPIEKLEPLDILIPADLSSAAFFLARGLLGGPQLRLRNIGVNATRSGFLDVVRRMHGTLHVEAREEFATEPVATLVTEPSQLVATRIDGNEVPRLVDEIPIIAAMATQADGTTEIVGAGELRVKESDRIAAMVANLRAVGADAEELHDGLVVRGPTPTLRGAIRSHGDHRVAMAFGVLASLPGNQIEIDDRDVVSVSFPQFWSELDKCAR